MEIDIANIISAAGTLLAAYFAYNQYTKNKLTDLKVEYFKKEEKELDKGHFFSNLYLLVC